MTVGHRERRAISYLGYEAGLLAFIEQIGGDQVAADKWGDAGNVA